MDPSLPRSPSPAAGGTRRPRWVGLRPWVPRRDELGLGESALILALYLGAVLLWSFGAFGVEVLLGGTVLAPVRPGAGASGVDALWHLGTAFVLALPTRHRWAVLLAPALALGLDIDHLFGAVFPTVVTRQAHALLFVVLVGLALYALRGRTAGLLAAGAVLAHIGVDGGSFPLFAPLSTAFFPLDLAGQVVFVAAAAILFFVSVRPWKDALAPRDALPIAGVVAALAVILFLAWPVLQGFTRV